MKVTAIVIILVTSLMACSKSPENPAPSQVSSPTSPAPQAPPPLIKLFSDVEHCAANCKTLYLPPQLKQNFDYTLELPNEFKDVLDTSLLREQFEAMVKQLPEEYRKVGLRFPEDLPEMEMRGRLSTVIENGNRKVYVYSLVRYKRPDSSNLDLDVAIDAGSKKLSALMRPTPNLDEYYLIGAQEPQVELLTSVMADDLRMAREQLRIARNPSEKYDFTGNPVILPFDTEKLAEMAPWLSHLSSRYESGRISNVSRPAASIEAKTLKEAATWYAADLNFSQCISTMSPAERITIIQEAGVRASTKDRNDSSGNLLEVEVSFRDGDNERFYRYFKRKTDCEESLPRSKPIDDRYR